MAKAGSSVKVQFLAFTGCSLADAAGENLEKALSDCGIKDYEAIDILAPGVADRLRAWGSPTILINGIDIAGQRQGDGVSCRVYPIAGRVPDVELIASRLNEAVTNGRA